MHSKTVDPYEIAFPAPAFTLRSTSFAAGDPLPATAYATGGDVAPDLTWGDLPDGTCSLVVTAFDPDAPIPGGFWHWAVKDIPVGGPVSGGVALANSLGVAGYSGVNPPPGTGTHRLFLCATALGTPRLDLPPAASLAMLHVLMLPHTLGRAILVGTSTPFAG
ncbi:YbhB/YbcL family Raf kinase inhibitor-like protein [Catenuloplanes japonicus]|uniref:YbhB/YbcL family Raf kinase inhibitor-like protein n=1 Tax=Catenuloplanes japonicus TaxID=33876 RepID=UPI000689C183|nr:YbhB/YbcL family Raf kinase inhibitor-like protein [Catenuloplanes japonicus]